MRYLLGAGFFGDYKDPVLNDLKHRVFDLWLTDTLAADPQPERSVLIIQGGVPPKVDTSRWEHECVFLENNLGAWPQFCNWKFGPRQKTGFMSGAAAAILTLAMLAYLNETDLLFKEQDVVIQGPWVEQMYKDCEGKQCVFGPCPVRYAATSLILIRHSFIPEFVKRYLELGPETVTTNLPEGKCFKMAKAHPEDFGRLSFGVDRHRPIPYDDPIWFAQPLNHQELDYISRRFYSRMV